MTQNTINYYDQNAVHVARAYEDADLSNVYEIIHSLYGVPSLLLEVGGGSGRDACALIGRGYEVIYSDASIRMAQEALHYHKSLKWRSIVCKLPEPLPFRDASFDGVIAIAVLMHLTAIGIVGSIREIHRVLKPGGKLVTSLPSARADMATALIDEKGRLMNLMDIAHLVASNFAVQFGLIATSRNSDGLSRKGIDWITHAFVKAQN